jgi:nucleoside-diphosphate-sugar epimerase
MRVLVFGGTGFVGSSLVPMLRRRQHEVAVLTRARELPAPLAACGARPLHGDLVSAAIADLDAGTFDAMVLLAGPRLFGKRLGRRRFRQAKAEITAIFSHALELASRRACPLVVTSGTSFRTTGEQVADESWPLERFGATQIGEDLDPLMQEAVAAGSPKLVCMLPGQIYGPGGMAARMVAMARKGRGAYFGDGDNCLPRIHVDDCAAAYLAAIERLDGLATGERFIVADDVAATAREFAECLAELLHAPKPKPLPLFLARLILGRRLVETATMHCRVSNAKAKRILGWAPRYPSFREGLRATVEALHLGGDDPGASRGTAGPPR